MEDDQTSQRRQIVEIISGDVLSLAVPNSGTGGSKNRCAGDAACGFYDAETASRDAKERSASIRKLLMAVSLCIVFMTIEVVGGIEANSLAILTDAAHLLSDVAAFAISLFSLWIAGWEANPRQSYGFFRIEILGALLSIQLLWLLAGILVYETIKRIIHDPGEVQGFLMFVVAAFGLVVNIIMAVLLGHDHGHGHGDDHDQYHGRRDPHEHGDQHAHSHDQSMESKHKDGHNHHVQTSVVTHVVDINDHIHEPLLKPSDASVPPKGSKQNRQYWNINVQGAYLHVLGDSIQSIGVMIGGGIIWYKPEWKIIDLICTLIFSLIVLGTTIKMLRNLLEVLLESTPREIDATRLEKGLCEMEGVVAVHELHIWAITLGKVLLACHVTVTRDAADAELILDKVVDYIRREYNISHLTIQIERQ